MAEAVLYAETRLGELIKGIPNQPEPSTKGRFGGSRPILPEGIGWKQSHYAQQLADNQDVVEQVIAEAKEPISAKQPLNCLSRPLIRLYSKSF